MWLPFRAGGLAALPLAAALCLAGGLAGGGARAAEAQFDFRVMGFPLGSVAMTWTTSGPRYGATANVDATGVVGFFTSFFFHGTATGTLAADGTVVPVRFEAESKSSREVTQTTIAWRNGAPATVTIVPPRDNVADPAEQGGTLDPVSAAFRLLRDVPQAEACNVSVDMFDGSRRSRLKVAKAEAQGAGLVCRGSYTRMKGDALGSLDRNQFPFTLTYSVGADGIARVERIEAPTNFGTAVVARRG